MVDVGDDDNGVGVGDDVMCIEGEWNLCWFCSLIHIPMTKLL